MQKNLQRNLLKCFITIIKLFIVKSLNITLIKRDIHSVTLNLPLDRQVNVRVNSSHVINLPGAGDFEINYLSANTSYVILSSLLTNEFTNMIYMQEITFKTGIFHIFKYFNIFDKILRYSRFEICILHL